tara:strand:+ start:567 stop:935 length:369 start_codon:yes stop_codon:yes gene_type:complete
MEIILIPILYYTFFGFLIIFSILNKIQLTKKLIRETYLFNFYASAEFLIASLLVIHSFAQLNYVLIIIGSLLFLSSIYSFWKREELLVQIDLLGHQYEYLAAFMSFFIAALIYFFDSAYTVT